MKEEIRIKYVLKRSMKRMNATKSMILSIAAVIISWGQTFAIEKYTDPAGVNKRIEQIRQSAPGMVRVDKMAVSPGGREVLMMVIGKPGQAAVFVAANMSGTNPVATEAALSLAARIAGDEALSKQLTWYILPLGNPDAYSRYFSQPLYLDPANGAAYNEDNDDQTDEDGYNDLDGNGIITQMRVKAPDGIWIPVAGEPRLMRKADPAKGEKGIYKLYSEGTDDDGDGLYNEDLPGGTNVDANFPHLFRAFDRRSGLYPGSAPETTAILKFVFSHPEIAMVFSFGSTNYLLAPPQGGRKGSVDMDNIRIPEEIGKSMGIDVSRSYTMAEIMDYVQPMLPPGMTVDENMIASYLGLGAVVNPMQEDLAFYNEISSDFKEYLKKKGVTGERFDPAQPEEGSFEMWAYYHLGVPVFTMDLWGLPKPKEEKKENSTITVETLEKMSSDEFLALGEEKINEFLKARGAPAQYNAKMIIGMVRGGQVTPAQMAGMIRQMPAPKSDDKKGDPKEMARLAFSDQKLAGTGFIPWKTYKHPSLGEVEIGGFNPFIDTAPPPAMLDSLLDLQLPYLFELVKRLPRLMLTDLKVTEKGGSVYQVEAWVTNEGSIPFPTAMGKRNKAPAPAVLTLEGTGTEILSGKKRTPINEVGGKKAVRYIWLVRAPKKNALTLRLESKQAGSDVRQINIGG